MIVCDFRTGYNRPIVIGLGFFDSVHYGHRKIIEQVRSLAAECAAEAALFTFSNNAYKQFNAQGKLIYTLDERLSILERQGVQCAVTAKFDKTFKAIAALAFLDRLTERFAVKGIVCGYDYLFGAGGKGDTELLREYCAQKGIACVVLDPIELNGERVSSTEIRQCLTAGDVEKAAALLTEPFFMTGTVVAGRGEGHLFGFPTANLSFPVGKLTPAEGVYATVTSVDGTSYRSVTNVGTKPTFGDMRFSVETFIDGDLGALYGKRITVAFKRFLRPIKKFDSPEALSKQIHIDIADVGDVR